MNQEPQKPAAGDLLDVRFRNRAWYLLACAATLAAGLASRRFPGLLPAFFGKYPGDALWSLMVFFGLGVILPAASRLRIAAWALGISYTVEFLKLWQAPSLVGLRHTSGGHLVFGHVFGWQNLIAYAVGVALGLLVTRVAARQRSRRPGRGLP